MRKTNVFLSLTMVFVLFSGWVALDAQQQAQAVPTGDCFACDSKTDLCRKDTMGYVECLDGSTTVPCGFSGEACMVL